MKTFENLSQHEMDELKRLSMSVRPVGSDNETRYQHLISRLGEFGEGDYEDFEIL